ncbi:MAG: S9 family peptidase, partial [Caldimonas sp.]
MTTSRFFTLLALAWCLFSGPARAAEPVPDPYLWLEDVASERALDWARARNAETHGALEKRAGYASTYASLLRIYNSRDRIATVTRRGEFFYNFWQDEEHQRGIVRRTTLASYRRGSVDWETVLDIDAL